MGGGTFGPSNVSKFRSFMKMLVCFSDFEKGVLEAFHMFINIFKDYKTLVEHSFASRRVYLISPIKKIFDIISLKKGEK